MAQRYGGGGMQTAGFMDGFLNGYQVMAGAQESRERMGMERERFAMQQEEAKQAQVDRDRRRAQEDKALDDEAYLNKWNGFRGDMISIARQYANDPAGRKQALAQRYNALSPEDQDYLSRDILHSPLTATPERRAKSQELFNVVGGFKGADLNAAIAHANDVYAEELNQGVDDKGAPAKSKRISRVIPSQDGGIYVELEVTRQDGSRYYAPLTDGRDANADAKVRRIGGRDFAESVLARAALADMGDLLDPALAGRGDAEAVKRLSRETGYDLMEVKLGDRVVLVDKKSGRKVDEYAVGESPDSKAKAKNGSSVGGGDLPAEAKLIEYYVAKGMSFEAAQRAAKRSKENPNTFAAELYKDLLKADSDRVALEGGEPRSRQELMDEARRAADYFFGNNGGGREAESPAGMAMAVSHVPGDYSSATGDPATGKKGVVKDGSKTYAVVDAADGDQVSMVQRYLASLLGVGERQAALQVIGQENPELAAALGGSGKESPGVAPAKGRQAQIATGRGGMQTPYDTMKTMAANFPQDNKLSQFAAVPADVVKSGLNQLLNYFVTAPAKAAASDIAAPFKGFQQWAQTRYQRPDAVTDPAVLEMYAKENPQGAAPIYAAIQ